VLPMAFERNGRLMCAQGQTRTCNTGH